MKWHNCSYALGYKHSDIHRMGLRLWSWYCTEVSTRLQHALRGKRVSSCPCLTPNIILLITQSTFQWPRGLRRRFDRLDADTVAYESRLMHGCLCFCVVLSCLGRGLYDGRSLVQKCSTKCLNTLRKIPCVRRPRSLQGL
jgi:hypothetical protein